ncbi:MAG: glycosyltransferase family 39 protein [Chloroflexi bacterium]|nr:glycosyltransferase family 39 protein [Chloroflexota bacterium]
MPTPSRAASLFLVLILGLYLAIGAQYAVFTPAWQVPDEPAHFNYIRHLATTLTFPVLQQGDYDQKYLSELTTAGFPPQKPVDSLRYESHQPPLYYLLATPIYLAAGGALLPLRLFSLLLGAGVIVFAFLVVRELFPAEPALALTAAGFAAFVPQHVAMMAGVNNDSLAELVIGAVLWRAMVWLRRTGTQGKRGNQGTAPGFGVWFLEFGLLGVLVGAAFVTKTTAYVVAPVVGLAIIMRGRREGWGTNNTIRALAIVFIPALAIGALWWGRDIAVYGWPDVLGLRRHDAIVVGQPRTAEWIAEYGAGEVALRFAVTTFRSFWGQFGWMGVVMDARLYQALLAFSVFIFVGFIYAGFGHAQATPFTPEQRDGLMLLLASGLLTAAVYLYYNVTFVQHQGRYLFPALIPIAFGAAAGLSGWERVAYRVWLMAYRRGVMEQGAEQPSASIRHMPSAITHLLPLGLTALLAALDVFALYRFIVPGLSGR